MEIEKIKVNLSKEKINKLNNDMVTFDFYKKDSEEINKNKFINILIKNYFPIYNNEADKLIEKYNKIIDNYYLDNKIKTAIVNELIFSNDIFAFNKDDYLSESISFKPGKAIMGILSVIEKNFLKNQSLSSFFRNMFNSYLSLPQFKREQIIFQETYELIQEAVDSNLKVQVYLKSGGSAEVSPYKIATNKEEIHNYLVGMDKGKTVKSYRLSKIDYIYKMKEKVSFNPEDYKTFNRVIKNGVQFAYSDSETIIVKMTKGGKELYKKKYLNRPMYTKIEDDIYYFDCAYAQAYLYFFPFGKNALIIEPISLKKQLEKEYLEAFELYNSK